MRRPIHDRDSVRRGVLSREGHVGQPEENQSAGQGIPVQNTKLAGIWRFYNGK
jgi:hypothetical protein